MNDGHGKVRTKPKAVVIGGSMAGLFTALLLRRAGWQVDVYERRIGQPRRRYRYP